MKFKVKVMSTGRSGSNNGSNQKLCSCRFLSGGEKSGCGGVLAPRSLVTAGATPAATHCPHLGLVIPSRRGEVTNWEQSLGVQKAATGEGKCFST